VHGEDNVSGEVYRKLVALKGGRSFSEVIDELTRARVRKRAEMIIAALKGGVSPELEEAVRLVRGEFRARPVEDPL